YRSRPRRRRGSSVSSAGRAERGGAGGGLPLATALNRRNRKSTPFGILQSLEPAGEVPGIGVAEFAQGGDRLPAADAQPADRDDLAAGGQRLRGGGTEFVPRDCGIGGEGKIKQGAFPGFADIEDPVAVARA